MNVRKRTTAESFGCDRWLDAGGLALRDIRWRITVEEKGNRGEAVNQESLKTRESVPKTGKNRGPNGVPTSGPQVFGCVYCRARFNDYDEFRKHKREEHGA